MIKDNSRACQKLVNAQVSVNRAVWAMNEQPNPDSDAKKHDGDISDKYIVTEVKAAITDLTIFLETISMRIREGYVPLTKENQKKGSDILDRRGRKAFIDTTNWDNRGCWVYFKNYKNGANSGLIKYEDFHNWMIRVER